MERLRGALPFLARLPLLLHPAAYLLLLPYLKLLLAQKEQMDAHTALKGLWIGGTAAAVLLMMAAFLLYAAGCAVDCIRRDRTPGQLVALHFLVRGLLTPLICAWPAWMAGMLLGPWGIPLVLLGLLLPVPATVLAAIHSAGVFLQLVRARGCTATAGVLGFLLSLLPLTGSVMVLLAVLVFLSPPQKFQRLRAFAVPQDLAKEETVCGS